MISHQHQEVVKLLEKQVYTYTILHMIQCIMLPLHFYIYEVYNNYAFDNNMHVFNLVTLL